LKEFGLNLKRKVCFKKKEFEKEKKKKERSSPSHLSAQPGLPAHQTFLQQPT
jgi:hypothetical protein